MEAEIRNVASGYFEKPKRVRTVSHLPLKALYTPKDVEGFNYELDIADAGKFPYTRGIYPTMYRGRLWTRRVGWGYGTPKDTNQQLKFLLREGNTALTIFPDLELVEGIDPDHPLAKGEVGRVGVAYYSIEDMEEMMEGIPMDKVSMTLLGATCAAPVIFSLYLAVAKSRGIDFSKLRGTTANDPLHSYHCRSKEANPIDLALKTAVDVIEFSTRHVNLWNPISVNSYDMRDLGISAPQEVAFGLAMATAYVRGVLERGLEVDEFAPRLSFYCNAGTEIFEEVAKLRAMRRMWAKIMRYKFKARNEASLKFRFATHTSGSSLTQREPLNNIVRIAYQQLVAVLGGAQSANSCTFLEALSVPTELSQRLALRTQQVLAYETNVPNVVDPLGGSYYVEWLTDKIVEEVMALIQKIDGMTFIGAMKSGWLRKEIEKSAWKQRKDLDSGDRIKVGVNKYVTDEKLEMRLHKTDPGVEKVAVQRVKEFRAKRNNQKTTKALREMKEVAETFRDKWPDSPELMPAIIEAVRADATLGEMMGVMRQTFGFRYNY